MGSNGSELWQELWTPLWSRYERVVRGILEFLSWSLDKGISPGSSLTEDGPGPSCAVPGRHFPFQEDGVHSVVWTEAPRGLHFTLYQSSLFLCFAVLRYKVVLHPHVDKFPQYLWFLSKADRVIILS